MALNIAKNWKLPAAALAVPDAMLLHRLLSEGKLVRVGFTLTCHREPDSPSANVVGEVPGRERADEIVLLGAHLDFDYGDEEMLSRLGAVSRRTGAPLLLVGRAPYTTVIVPSMRTIRSTTLKLLHEFQAVGGRVVFAGVPAARNSFALATTALKAAGSSMAMLDSALRLRATPAPIRPCMNWE